MYKDEDLVTGLLSLLDVNFSFFAGNWTWNLPHPHPEPCHLGQVSRAWGLCVFLAFLHGKSHMMEPFNISMDWRIVNLHC